MLTLENLRSFGADTASGLERCMGMEALYLRLVNIAKDEKNFDLLSDALNSGDLDAAFSAAHALKGVLGNLSLTPMYDIATEITELLRAKSQTDYSPYLEKLLELRERLRKICA